MMNHDTRARKRWLCTGVKETHNIITRFFSICETPFLMAINLEVEIKLQRHLKTLWSPDKGGVAATVAPMIIFEMDCTLAQWHSFSIVAEYWFCWKIPSTTQRNQTFPATGHLLPKTPKMAVKSYKRGGVPTMQQVCFFETNYTFILWYSSCVVAESWF